MQAKRVVSDGVAYEATQILKQVVTSGTGTRARLDDGRPQAGKTGPPRTTATPGTAATRPDIATCVWVGYRSSNKPLENIEGFGAVYGGTIPAMIWKDFMTTATRAHQGRPTGRSRRSPMVYRDFDTTTSFGYNPAPPAAPATPDQEAAPRSRARSRR